MRKLIIFFAAAMVLAACKPEIHTGPLDSPIGNWDGVKAEYYFNGEWVAETQECEYPAISFYKEGLCCIEGVKGAFPYTYDNASGIMVVDSTVWAVKTLTGTEMVLEYLERIISEDDEPETPELPEEPEVPEVKPDENGLILPVEYNGVNISADKHGYYYECGYERIYCQFYGTKDETGTLLKDESGAVIIEFWYDGHIDHFIPLVRELKK
jgi:hypothetical protein